MRSGDLDVRISRASRRRDLWWTGCVGIFTLGPNAVLPTNAAALTRSPLSAHDYLKSAGVGYATRAGYETLAPYAKTFAEYEGFDSRALAVSDTRARAERSE